MVEYGLDLSAWGLGQEVASFEHDNELSGSRKCGKSFK